MGQSLVAMDRKDLLFSSGTDSCAAASSTMLDPLWRERLPLCDRLIAVRPDAAFGRGRLRAPLRGLILCRP